MAKRGHSVDCVDSAEAALQRLSLKNYPMIFLDIGLPGMSGLELNRRVRANDTEPPTYVLVGTGETGEKRLREILDAGADDYVAKPYQLSILDTRLAVAEKGVQSLEQQSRMQRELTFLAEHDPLTGLLNRGRLETILREASQSDSPTVLLQMDLDHFKQINDSFGHLVGDRHLREVAQRMREILPDSTHIVRFGGDEFVAVLPDRTIKQATGFAEQLINTISELKVGEGPLNVRSGASVGLSLMRSEATPSETLREADAACYRAKSMGKNCVQAYVSFDSDLFAEEGETTDRSDPAEAPEGDRLELWFQPICDLSDGSLSFQEALLRFIPANGKPAVDAAMFMAEINSAQRAPSLDRFVIRRICRELARYPELTASVNINAVSICDWSFVQYVEERLAEADVEGGRLILEITETNQIPDLPLARSVVEQLASMGVRSALDDLGAGFTSIPMLKYLPIGLVKVDGALIRDLSSDRFNRSFIDALGRLAKGLDFETVGERIETREELAEAKHLGICYGQGHLFGAARRKPYTAGELADSFAAAN